MNRPDLYQLGVDCDSKEIQIPRNDLIRGRRTGIIITLLPISSETTMHGRKKNGQLGTREKKSEKKKERERNAREKDRRERERETKRDEAFCSKHPVYRSVVRDAGPTAWRSRQIIITNHQLFARNG